MGFESARLPDPTSYFESEGLTLTGPPSAKWKTTGCIFHGSRATMRINTASGAWVCMAGCGARGGDVLAYHMAAHGLEFVEAAKALGCWLDDGKPQTPHRPTPLTPRAALQVLSFEATVTAVAAGNLANGVDLTDDDRERLLTAANRITRLVEVFA